MNVIQDETSTVSLLLNKKESVGEIIDSPLIGEKISTSGMLLDPYEAVLEDIGNDPFRDIPEEIPDKKWMYQDEIDEGKPTFPQEWFEKDQSVL